LALSAGLSWNWLSHRSWAERSDVSQLEQNLGTVRDQHQQTRDEVEQVKEKAKQLEGKAAQVDELERQLAQEQQNVREMQAGMQRMGRDVSGLRDGLRRTQRAVDAKVWQIDQSSLESRPSSTPVVDTQGPYHPKLPTPPAEHHERLPHP
jgi:septal ring factor EnvC (AmiA/AmiB activator)